MGPLACWSRPSWSVRTLYQNKKNKTKTTNLSPTPKNRLDVCQIYECGEDSDAAFVTKQAAKLLVDSHVAHNSDLTIEDFMQEMNVLMSIIHDDSLQANEFEVALPSSLFPPSPFLPFLLSSYFSTSPRPSYLPLPLVPSLTNHTGAGQRISIQQPSFN